MKTKKINAKLILNKEKISELTSTAKKTIVGGGSGYSTNCNCGGGDTNTIYTCICRTSA